MYNSAHQYQTRFNQIILAKNKKYTILNKQIGSGTFGNIYSGFSNYNPSMKLAFKFMIPPEKKEGFMSKMHAKELIFFSEQTEYNQENNSVIKCIDIINSDELKSTQKEYLVNTPILILPLYKQDFQSFFKHGIFNKNQNLQYALFFIKKILELILNLHKQNISHNDLKMNNIVMDEDYDMKLIDFGSYKYDNLNQQQIDKQNYPGFLNLDLKYEIQMNSIQQAALTVRLPEQAINFKKIKEEHGLRMFIGQYSDSYIVGQIMFEILMGIPFTGPAQQNQKQEDLVLGQLLTFFRDWNNIYNFNDIDETYDKDNILNYQKQYKSQIKEQFKDLTLQQTIEEILSQKYKWDNQIYQLSFIISKLMEPDIEKRQLLIQLQDEFKWILESQDLTLQQVKDITQQLNQQENKHCQQSIFTKYFLSNDQ